MNELTPLIGLFVGGRGLRLGGVDKGNLRLPSGQRVIERLLSVSRRALADAQVVLVGQASAYADLGLLALADAPAGIGPIGGLRALLLHALQRGQRSVIVLACDLPFVSEALLRRLADEVPAAAFLGPREVARTSCRWGCRAKVQQRPL